MCKPWSLEWKARELEQLKQRWAQCQQCPDLVACRHKIVMGKGNPDADLMLIGEAPGYEEDRKGEPFVGESGSLLKSMFAGLRIAREEVFLTNIVACRPEDNRDPQKDERLACASRLYEEIYIVDPVVIVLAGKVPMKAMLGGRAMSVEREFGVFRKVTIPGRRAEAVEYDVVTTWHPAYILREDNPNKDGVYPRGGPGDNTFRVLKSVLEVIDEVKYAYQHHEERYS